MRLANALKEKIAREYAEKIMKPRQDAQKEAFESLALRIYKHAMKGIDTDKIPVMFKSFRKTFYVSISERGFELELPESDWLPCGYSHATYISIFEKGHPIEVEFNTLRSAGRAISNDFHNLKQRTLISIGLATTLKRLISVWPEEEEFLLGFVPVKPKNLPEVTMSGVTMLAEQMRSKRP